MKDKTLQKITILQDKNVITKATKEKVIQVDDLLQQQFVTFNEHDSDFLFTHLSMAIDRTSKGTPLTDVNDIILDQIKQSTAYPKALQLLKKVSQLINTDFNEAETVMILIHFCSLIEMRG